MATPRVVDVHRTPGYYARRQEELRRAAAEGTEIDRLINLQHQGASMATTSTTISTSSASTRPPVSPFDARTGRLAATDTTPLLVTSLQEGGLLVIVVGAGGTGARVVPPLAQMLRPHDAMAIIDHDIVEDRNLLRQHFGSHDIGQHKAAVLASRYARPGRVPIRAYARRLDADTSAHTLMNVWRDAANGLEGQPAGRQLTGVVFIGCVDNAAARVAMRRAMTLIRSEVNASLQVAWIDAGNETRSGQVILSLHHWNARVKCADFLHTGVIDMPSLATAMPQLLIPDPAAEAAASCAERIDFQTVQVNHLAAAGIINCLSWLLMRLTFASCGSHFTTLNTMQPIKLASVDDHMIIRPEETWADADALKALAATR